MTYIDACPGQKYIVYVFTFFVVLVIQNNLVYTQELLLEYLAAVIKHL